MGLPRSKYVKEGQEGVYHCFSRCVRRAFLYGHDALTNRDYFHRKAWLVDRLRYLAAVFAIEVCAYAIMENHYHTILRTRPDIVASWTDWEVATRWLTLFPQHRAIGGETTLPTEEEIRALANRRERIELLRKRLCSLSWFMGRLNEYIARAANKEDDVKGRFWESRFKCQALLDEGAIAACMVYVDLNPIRAGLASTPEGSEFTSIQERIRVWQEETKATGSISLQAAKDSLSGDVSMDTIIPEGVEAISGPIPGRVSAVGDSHESETLSTCWLCPISTESHRRGVLRMTAAEYIDLVDVSGRMIRPDKRGAIDAEIRPMLERIGANPDAWMETVTRFGSKFRLVAGMISNLRNLADQLGRRWLMGIAAARTAFAPSLP
jgi:putative transposase